jgi:hypothetical protein
MRLGLVAVRALRRDVPMAAVSARQRAVTLCRRKLLNKCATPPDQDAADDATKCFAARRCLGSQSVQLTSSYLLLSPVACGAAPCLPTTLPLFAQWASVPPTVLPTLHGAMSEMRQWPMAPCYKPTRRSAIADASWGEDTRECPVPSVNTWLIHLTTDSLSLRIGLTTP